MQASILCETRYHENSVKYIQSLGSKINAFSISLDKMLPYFLYVSVNVKVFVNKDI